MKTLQQLNPKRGDVVYKGVEEESKTQFYKSGIYRGYYKRFWRKGYTPWVIREIVKRGCVVEIKTGYGSPHKHLIEWTTKVTKTGNSY